MGRIFCGLYQIGAWQGCFDEFNQFEERILCAANQQILTILRGQIDRQHCIELEQSIHHHLQFRNYGMFSYSYIFASNCKSH